MSRYQDARHRWLASFRRFAASIFEILASSNGVYLIPPPSLGGTAPDAVTRKHRAAAPEDGSTSPDVASAPLTADECLAWERLVRELGGESMSD